MPLLSLLAKDWVLEVDTSATATPTWTRVNGLTSISLNLDSNMEDDSDFDSGGWGSQVVTQRSWSVEIEGRRKRNSVGASFTADPGQEKLRLAGFIVSVAANVQIRVYRKDGAPDAYTGYAAVDYNGGGGGVTDLEPFAVTLSGQGALTTITNPTVV